LNDAQAAFVREYLKCFNATQSAIRAGYSEKTAYSQGQRLLKHVEVSAAIDQAIMSADEAATNISEIARGDMADLMSITTSGFMLELMIKNPETGEMIVNPATKLIKKIKQKTTIFIAKKESDEDREVTETEIELYSRHDANRDILKYRGKLIDKSELSGPGGGPIETSAVMIYIPSNGRETK
jgi:phage terminase small subunit